MTFHVTITEGKCIIDGALPENTIIEFTNSRVKVFPNMTPEKIAKMEQARDTKRTYLPEYGVSLDSRMPYSNTMLFFGSWLKNPVSVLIINDNIAANTKISSSVDVEIRGTIGENVRIYSEENIDLRKCKTIHESATLEAKGDIISFSEALPSADASAPVAASASSKP